MLLHRLRLPVRPRPLHHRLDSPCLYRLGLVVHWYSGYAECNTARRKAGSSEGAGKWGVAGLLASPGGCQALRTGPVPGNRRMRKKAKDSVDGGPLKVAADDEVRDSQAARMPLCTRLNTHSHGLAGRVAVYQGRAQEQGQESRARPHFYHLLRPVRSPRRVREVDREWVPRRHGIPCARGSHGAAA